MRLSELLNSEVVDETGHALGRVDDVRVVPDGPTLGHFGRALRIEGLAVGGSGLSVRLGLHRKKMRGPWLLKALFGRLEDRARYVRWEQVVSYDDGRVTIRGEPSSLPED